MGKTKAAGPDPLRANDLPGIQVQRLTDLQLTKISRLCMQTAGPMTTPFVFLMVAFKENQRKTTIVGEGGVRFKKTKGAPNWTSPGSLKLRDVASAGETRKSIPACSGQGGRALSAPTQAPGSRFFAWLGAQLRKLFNPWAPKCRFEAGNALNNSPH